MEHREENLLATLKSIWRTGIPNKRLLERYKEVTTERKLRGTHVNIGLFHQQLLGMVICSPWQTFNAQIKYLGLPSHHHCELGAPNTLP